MKKNIDPSIEEYKCEAPGCTRTAPLRNMHSIAVCYRMPGVHALEEGRVHEPYQCGDEQHLGCCHEHAVLAALKCLFVDIEHGSHAHQKQEQYYDPELEAIAQIILPKQSSNDVLPIYQQQEEQMRAKRDKEREETAQLLEAQQSERKAQERKAYEQLFEEIISHKLTPLHV